MKGLAGIVEFGILDTEKMTKPRVIDRRMAEEIKRYNGKID